MAKLFCQCVSVARYQALKYLWLSDININIDQIWKESEQSRKQFDPENSFPSCLARRPAPTGCSQCSTSTGGSICSCSLALLKQVLSLSKISLGVIKWIVSAPSGNSILHLIAMLFSLVHVKNILLTLWGVMNKVQEDRCLSYNAFWEGWQLVRGFQLDFKPWL